MIKPRLGPQQTAIARALHAGEQLTAQDGIWCLGPEGELSRPVSGASCRRMHARGLLMFDRAEDHPAYLGGRCEWYALTEACKQVLEQEGE